MVSSNSTTPSGLALLGSHLFEIARDQFGINPQLMKFFPELTPIGDFKELARSGADLRETLMSGGRPSVPQMMMPALAALGLNEIGAAGRGLRPAAEAFGGAVSHLPPKLNTLFDRAEAGESLTIIKREAEEIFREAGFEGLALLEATDNFTSMSRALLDPDVLRFEDALKSTEDIHALLRINKASQEELAAVESLILRRKAAVYNRRTELGFPNEFSEEEISQIKRFNAEEDIFNHPKAERLEMITRVLNFFNKTAAGPLGGIMDIYRPSNFLQRRYDAEDITQLLDDIAVDKPKPKS